MNDIVFEKATMIAKALEPIAAILPEYFIVAGGAFRVGAPINDYDLYPHDFHALPTVAKIQSLNIKHEILAQTKNSLTVRFEDINKTVQFCNYVKDDLGALVKSFDFNDIQAGAIIENSEPNEDEPFTHLRVFICDYTNEYDRYAIHGQVQYMGTEYPLSTLIRLGKYRVSRSARVIMTLEILADVCSRGFNGYEDFKNQLDAVDLQIVLPDHLGGVADSNLAAIYKRLNDRPSEHWAFVVEMEESEANEDAPTSAGLASFKKSMANSMFGDTYPAHCVRCKKGPFVDDDFKDELSCTEWHLSQFCQACQDGTFDAD